MDTVTRSPAVVEPQFRPGFKSVGRAYPLPNPRFLAYVRSLDFHRHIEQGIADYNKRLFSAIKSW